MQLCKRPVAIGRSKPFNHVRFQGPVKAQPRSRAAFPPVSYHPAMPVFKMVMSMSRGVLSQKPCIHSSGALTSFVTFAD